MPYKRNPGPRGKRHVRQNVPATVRVPVIVARIHTAIRVNSLNNCNVPKISSALHSWLQNNDRGHMRPARNNPARSGCSICPLVRISKPRNPISCQSMITHISPIGTLAKSKTIETASSRLSDYSHTRIKPVLFQNGCCRRLLGNQTWTIIAIMY